MRAMPACCRPLVGSRRLPESSWKQWQLLEISIENGKVERQNRLPQNREKRQILRY